MSTTGVAVAAVAVAWACCWAAGVVALVAPDDLATVAAADSVAVAVRCGDDDDDDSRRACAAAL